MIQLDGNQKADRRQEMQYELLTSWLGKTMQRKNCLVQLNSSDVPQPKQVPPALILKN
jgi:hypothetical protein